MHVPLRAADPGLPPATLAAGPIHCKLCDSDFTAAEQ